MKQTFTNGELYQARMPYAKLAGVKFPMKTAMAIAKQGAAFNPQLVIIETLRQKLVQQYGSPNPKNLMEYTIYPGHENYAKFSEELNVLYDEEYEVDIDVVMLPEMVASTCDKCGHNMDRPLELEPAILMALSRFVSFEESPAVPKK